jgi:antitoxin component YwqK of YwqJK toxin-antitoxin module
MTKYLTIILAICFWTCGKGTSQQNSDKKENKPEKEESFYLNGQVQFSYPLVNGVRNGTSTSYYQDGTVWAKNEWKDGKLHGTCKTFMPNGELEKEELWSDSHLKERKIYWQKAGKQGYLFVSKEGFYTMKDGKMVELDETTPDNVIEEVFKPGVGPTYPFIWKNGKREPWE